MNTKYKVGEKVYFTNTKSNALVKKVLHFFNEDKIIYKIQIGETECFCSEEMLKKSNSLLNFLKKRLCTNM